VMTNGELMRRISKLIDYVSYHILSLYRIMNGLYLVDEAESARSAAVQHASDLTQVQSEGRLGH
jgi:hypothetical protein